MPDKKLSPPAHVGIIMDGNGRWAKKRLQPRTMGHRAGAQNFRTITRYAAKIGIQYLTIYTFSTENWSRPAEEVGALMRLFKEYLQEALRDFMEENIRVRFIGDRSGFSQDLQALMKEVEEASGVKTGMVLNLAMNYGGRAEIVRAARAFAGTHDFRAVRSVGTETRTTVRTIEYCRVTRSADLLELKVCANGFLYNMVRAITGTVLYAAEGKLTPEDIPAILASGNRTLAGPTVPPGGLYLTKLWYEDERLNG